MLQALPRSHRGLPITDLAPATPPHPIRKSTPAHCPRPLPGASLRRCLRSPDSACPCCRRSP
ncbi:hypothetical protein [Lysobacter gummosus]|uniref:hypothetical protein n=1 Tax=Lysobacter gummosus TaxID=262324 RepID=UPI0036270F00